MISKGLPVTVQITTDHPEDIPRAYATYYSRMANYFSRLILPRKPGVVLEAGCGRGQLTLPLLRELPARAKIIAVDSAKGPYFGWLGDVEQRLDQAGLTSRVRLVEADVGNMRGIRPGSIDVVVSNELLCDLPRKQQLLKVLREFRRVLRPGGLMIHGEWSSVPETTSHRTLAVKHKPSWNPDQLFLAMNDLEYKDFRAIYFDTTIHFAKNAAIEELRSWGASREWLKRNDGMLRKHGIQLPPEHIVVCVK